jgi:Ankyrin repeats (3 copies)
MEYCCICLGDIQSPVILNSGATLCGQCIYNVRRCPSNYIEITAKLPNKFATEFFRYPPVPPIFSMEKLLKSPDKIAYMNQFDEIELGNPMNLINNRGGFVLNIDEFKVFASKCIDLNRTNYDELFGYACIYGNLDIVKCLVVHGADVNLIDIWGHGSIYNACYCGDEALELVKFLVAHGADINCDNNGAERPIHSACYGGDKSLGLVKYLV